MLKICVIDWQSYSSLWDTYFYDIQWYVTMDSTRNAWFLTMWYTRQYKQLRMKLIQGSQKKVKESWNKSFTSYNCKHYYTNIYALWPMMCSMFEWRIKSIQFCHGHIKQILCIYISPVHSHSIHLQSTKLVSYRNICIIIILS